VRHEPRAVELAAQPLAERPGELTDAIVDELDEDRFEPLDTMTGDLGEELAWCVDAGDLIDELGHPGDRRPTLRSR